MTSTILHVYLLSHFSQVQLFRTLWIIACQVPLSMGFSRQEYWIGLPCSPPRDLPNPGIKPRSPALQVASLPAESPGKAMNTGVGSLSLLQGIFLTQKSNWDPLHCRQILYQLSYQGSPFPCVEHSKTQIGSATCSAVRFLHTFSKRTRNSLEPHPISVLLNG